MAAAALSRHEVNRIILTRPAVEAGERLGFLPGDLMAKVDPYLRPLFDALHDMLDPEKVSAAHRARRDRDRAARLHARPHAERLVRDPRRGPEHDPRADEDVPDAARLRLADGRHRRHHAGRPAARAAVRADRRRRRARVRSRGSTSCASAARTSSATSSCSGSSRPTTSHAQREAPSSQAAARARPARPSAAPEPAMLDVEVFGERLAPGRASASGEVRRLCELARVEPRRRRRSRRGRVRRRASASPSSTSAIAASRADRRAVVPDRRRRGDSRTARRVELGDVVICPTHTDRRARGDRPRRCCTCSAWTTRRDDGEMLSLQRRAARRRAR